MSPWLEHILAHAMPIGLRAGGLMTFAPFFGDQAVPARVKAGFTIVLTAMLYGVCSVPDMSLTPGNWIRIVATEAAVGMMMGLSVRLVIDGMQVAGQLAGAQLGFSLAAIIDPQTNIDTPVLAVLHQTVALLIFLQFDVHHWLLRGVVKSFDYLPVGMAVVNLATVQQLVHSAAAMWMIGVQIAAPVLMATMLVDLTVGFLSKASPQFPALLLGISTKSLVGYLMLATAAALWPHFLEGQFTNALGWSEKMLHLAH